MSKINVLVADDHEIVRYGICSVLATDPEVEVIYEADSGASTLKGYKKHKPDVSIIDVSMPDMNGIETTESIREYDPDARILILTMHMNEEYLKQVLQAGALGYMLKNSNKKELLDGIHAVARGKQYFSEQISKMMTEKYVRMTRKQEQEPQSETVSITKREREILRLIVDGYTSHEIAQLLYISPRTVETHRANLMQKLNIKNTAGLVRYALEHDILEKNG